MSKTILYLLSIFLLSCSSIKISSGTSQLVSSEAAKKEEVIFPIRKEYFLWGLIPNYHEINVNDNLRSKGYQRVEKFSVKRERQAGDVIWSILSLGVYTPQTFILKAKVE